jgi:multidrug efflux pump subunit AcrA (membrane-fusion protein)
MRFLVRSLVAVGLLAVTLAVLALAGYTVIDAMQQRLADKAAPRAVRERVFAATVLPVRLGDVTPELTVYGEVRSRRTLDMRAPRAGRIVWLADGFEDGAEVVAGQPLLRLDPADARAARDLALSDRARAEADARDAARALALARDELALAQSQTDLRQAAVERQRALRDRGVGSDAALETAELAVQQAQQSTLSRRQAVVHCRGPGRSGRRSAVAAGDHHCRGGTRAGRNRGGGRVRRAAVGCGGGRGRFGRPERTAGPDHRPRRNWR